MHSKDQAQGDGKCDCLLPLSWSLLVLKEQTQRGRKEERAGLLNSQSRKCRRSLYTQGFYCLGWGIKIFAERFYKVMGVNRFEFLVKHKVYSI